MQPCRVSHQEGFLDLVDVLGRGGSFEWQALYARVRQDEALRAELREAVVMTDPDLGSASELWGRLLDALDAQ